MPQRILWKSNLSAEACPASPTNPKRAAAIRTGIPSQHEKVDAATTKLHGICVGCGGKRGVKNGVKIWRELWAGIENCIWQEKFFCQWR